MRRTARAGVLSLLTLIITAAAGASQMPIQIAGHIATPEPLPVADGVYEVTLVIRTEPAGGEILWEQSYPKVPIRNGRLEAYFAGPASGLGFSRAWLEILVDGRVVGGPTETRANGSDGVEIWDYSLMFYKSFLSSPPISAEVRANALDLQILTFWGGQIQLSTGDGGFVGPGGLTIHTNGMVQAWGGSNATLADGSGYLLIGTDGLQNIVLDDDEIQARNNGAAATLFLQHQGGDIWFQNAPLHTSDGRKKRAIRDLDLGLDEILQLRPVSFEWKEQAGPRRPGLIGQEVREVIEEIVIEDEEGTLGLAYGSLIPVLIRSIQEQQEQIQRLEGRLAQLETLTH